MELLERQPKHTLLEITIYEGRNRQIRRMGEALDILFASWSASRSVLFRSQILKQARGASSVKRNTARSSLHRVFPVIE